MVSSPPGPSCYDPSRNGVAQTSNICVAKPRQRCGVLSKASNRAARGDAIERLRGEAWRRRAGRRRRRRPPPRRRLLYATIDTLMRCGHPIHGGGCAALGPVLRARRRVGRHSAAAAAARDMRAAYIVCSPCVHGCISPRMARRGARACDARCCNWRASIQLARFNFCDPSPQGLQCPLSLLDLVLVGLSRGKVALFLSGSVPTEKCMGSCRRAIRVPCTSSGFRQLPRNRRENTLGLHTIPLLRPAGSAPSRCQSHGSRVYSYILGVRNTQGRCRDQRNIINTQIHRNT
jgi:hypothetical protein